MFNLCPNTSRLSAVWSASRYQPVSLRSDDVEGDGRQGGEREAALRLLLLWLRLALAEGRIVLSEASEVVCSRQGETHRLWRIWVDLGGAIG